MSAVGWMTAAAPHVSIWLGIVVEIIALALVPLVVLRRKEPSSTAAWILALVFLPGLGATLFLLFGRDRVRLPVRWKRDADQALVKSRRRHHRHVSPTQRDALARIPTAVDRELFRISSALPGGEPSLGNAASLLVDGEATYAAIGEAIDAATHHVHAEYYLVGRGDVADWLAEKLIAAAASRRRGAAPPRRLRIVLDRAALGARAPRRRRRGRVLPAGAADLLPADEPAQPPQDRGRRRRDGVHRRHQRRGRVPRSRRQAPWRDTHLRVRGPAAQALRAGLRARLALRDAPRDPARPITSACEGARSRARRARGRRGRDRPQRAPTSRARCARRSIACSSARSPSRDRASTSPRRTSSRTARSSSPCRRRPCAASTCALLLPRRNNHPFVGQAGRSFYEDLLGRASPSTSTAPG